MVYGSWPTQADEIVLILNENNELDDLTLYGLGLKPEEEINQIFEAVLDKTEIDAGRQEWSYEEICDMEFRTILNADCYIYDENRAVHRPAGQRGGAALPV